MVRQPASAIQNTCSHTDISATQITCCARHLLAVHGFRERPASHKAGGFDRAIHWLCPPRATRREGMFGWPMSLPEEAAK